MYRISAGSAAFGVAILLASAFPGNRAAAESQHAVKAGVAENVLLITIDTLRWDALGFAGNPEIETPVLDRLASRSLVFTNAHAHNVQTLPSHANILTGLLPFQHGIRDNSNFDLEQSIPTAATVLEDAGFATGAFVGAFVLDSSFGLDRGFQTYDDEFTSAQRTGYAVVQRPGNEVVARALAWWKRNNDKRRFLWVHLYDPHTPYDPPEPFASLYPTNSYLGEVAATDRFLEPLLRPHLDGLEPPTLIILASDHGEALGDHGEADHEIFAYEATLRVPQLIYSPGLEPRRVDTPARHIDLLPTLLEAAGIDAPMGLPGRSLLRPLGPGESGATYFEALGPNLSRGWAPLRGVLDDNEKLIALPIPELYDLQADPGERNNLFDTQRDRARRLARLLPKESVWPPDPGEVSSEQRAKLEALGYLGGSATRKKSYTVDDDPKTKLGPLESKSQQVLAFFRMRDWDRAQAITEELREQYPDMEAPYTYLAQLLIQKGDLPGAVEIMLEARSRGVASPVLVKMLGTKLEDRALDALRSGDWVGARDSAQQAITLDENLDLAWSYLGTAQSNLGRRQDAMDAFQRSVEINPENYDALFNLGFVAMQAREASVARRAFERFLAEAPRDAYAADLPKVRGWLAQIPAD
jgi:arylsulfatase A-like enzyme